MKTAEEYYQEFRKMGFDHQQARELALKAESFPPHLVALKNE